MCRGRGDPALVQRATVPMKLEETYLHTGEVGADTAVQVQEEVHAWVLAHSQESA